MNKQSIMAGANIHAGDGGYREGTQEGYNEFVAVRNQSMAKMQIQELMKQAGTDISGKWMSIDNAEKFAELIVQECIEVADNNRTVMEIKTNIHLTADAIKQHFGVEQ